MPKAESFNDTGGAAVIMYLRKGKNHCMTAVKEEKNRRKTVLETVCKEGGGRRDSCSKSETPLQPVGKPMVKQHIAPLQTTEDHRRYPSW